MKILSDLLINGTVQSTAYGSGSNTGTPTYTLGVDTNGNVIELNTITGATNGLSVSNDNIELGGTLTKNTIVDCTSNYTIVFGLGGTDKASFDNSLIELNNQGTSGGDILLKAHSIIVLDNSLYSSSFNLANDITLNSNRHIYLNADTNFALWLQTNELRYEGTINQIASPAAGDKVLALTEISANSYRVDWIDFDDFGGGGSSLWTANGSNIYFNTGNVGIGVSTPTSKLQVSGDILPGIDAAYNLGSSSLRWKIVYTSDLSLKNERGDWTIVEGEDDLFLYNNKKDKVYKFKLEQVDPSEAPPKIEG